MGKSNISFFDSFIIFGESRLKPEIVIRYKRFVSLIENVSIILLISLSLIESIFLKSEDFIKENINNQKKIIKILETKIRPAVARDGGDIEFKEFKNGKVKVILKGSCSGCPSSTLTLKQGVQNLLCHYIPEVREVEAI